MKQYRIILFYLFIISLLLSTGYYRDFVFKKINALLQAWDHNLLYSMPYSLHFFENLEYETIVNIKWLLTLLFSLVYLAISLITIHFTFNTKKFSQITVMVYFSIIILSSFFIIIGMLAGSYSEKMYEFARYFMGMAQSPVILMILIPVFKITEKEKTAEGI